MYFKRKQINLEASLRSSVAGLGRSLELFEDVETFINSEYVMLKDKYST